MATVAYNLPVNDNNTKALQAQIVQIKNDNS